jgi:hypothetical protein
MSMRLSVQTMAMSAPDQVDQEIGDGVGQTGQDEAEADRHIRFEKQLGHLTLRAATCGLRGL